MDKLYNEKHEFALFFNNLTSLVASINRGNDFLIHDELLAHRLKNVLRLSVGDTCIFFDRTISVMCTIAEYTKKKQIVCIVNEKKNNQHSAIQITFLLPVLKRDDFEQALYALAEIGVTDIQLLVTHKARSSYNDKDKERAQRIIIAAAEQSKNFAFPVLKDPITLDQAVSLYAANKEKLFFDYAGDSLRDALQRIDGCHAVKQIVLLIGPEGDLTQEEKQVVRRGGFIFCVLTPTVLRSVQAASLGAGFIRSFFH